MAIRILQKQIDYQKIRFIRNILETDCHDQCAHWSRNDTVEMSFRYLFSVYSRGSLWDGALSAAFPIALYIIVNCQFSLVNCKGVSYV